MQSVSASSRMRLDKYRGIGQGRHKVQSTIPRAFCVIGVGKKWWDEEGRGGGKRDLKENPKFSPDVTSGALHFDPNP